MRRGSSVDFALSRNPLFSSSRRTSPIESVSSRHRLFARSRPLVLEACASVRNRRVVPSEKRREQQEKYDPNVCKVSRSSSSTPRGSSTV